MGLLRSLRRRNVWYGSASSCSSLRQTRCCELVASLLTPPHLVLTASCLCFCVAKFFASLTLAKSANLFSSGTLYLSTHILNTSEVVMFLMDKGGRLILTRVEERVVGVVEVW